MKIIIVLLPLAHKPQSNKLVLRFRHAVNLPIVRRVGSVKGTAVRGAPEPGSVTACHSVRACQRGGVSCHLLRPQTATGQK